MAVIRVLPPHLANQIAAGEVVERPASVVKELVENAVDAGARSVRVEIEAGGTARLRVTDDGCGMTRDDAILAIERHATSKIASADDLCTIGTLGFRGEALPSIASVSRFRLRTRAPGDLAGTEVQVDGEATPLVSDIGFATGTQVEVLDLFFNTPARLKFLKSHGTEAGHAIEAAVRVALPRPDLSVVVVRDGRIVRELLRQSELQSRVREVFPDEELWGAEGTVDGVAVRGWLGAPHHARAGATGLHTFVNGRHVRDRGLMRAVVQSYGGTLEAGRYPEGVVFLEIDPREVDVNVHPQKSEVRFARSSAIVGATTRVLTEVLRAAPWSRPRPQLAGPAAHEPRWAAPPPQAPSLFGTDLPAVRGFAARAQEPDAGAGRSPAGGLAGGTTERAEVEAGQGPIGPRHAAGSEPVAPTERKGLYASLQPIGQLRATYILCEGPDGLYVLDQHASHERVTFDRLRRGRRSREVAVQRLLFPERIEVDSPLVALAEDHRDALLAVGIEVEPLGTGTLALHAVPALVTRADPRRLVVDVLGEIGRTGAAAFTAAVDAVLATMACHGSIRAGDRLEPAECRALLVALDDVDFSGNCPHGRPILMTLPWGDLERRVGRR
ncbi:MAG: DNA mismatch repair endonuclease MutL [Deltaproteobacteria bacterium]|nr:DNA mismatch repair endonuclease MutL [Deltaproteobacteria bacterium]